MGYHIDFSKVSLEEFKTYLVAEDLVPSRKLLSYELDKQFKHLENQGFENVASLLTFLKNKKKMADLSHSSALEEKYLVILSREIRSWLPKPEKLMDFTFFSAEWKVQMEALNITHTKKLWNNGLTKKDRQKLAQLSQIPLDTITQWVCLADLCRVRWVNPNFAEILYKSGVFIAQQLALEDYRKLHEKVLALNDIHHWYKAKIGQNDFRLVVKAANKLSFDLKI
jgi:hypothetical protein